MRRTYRLLIVEENRLVRTMLARYLSNEGHEVAIADSPKRAFDALKNSVIEIMFLGVSSELERGNDDLELLERTKSAEELEHIAVIVMAEDVNAERVATAARKHGADGLLQKPFPLTALEATIRTAIMNLAATRAERSASASEGLARRPGATGPDRQAPTTTAVLQDEADIALATVSDSDPGMKEIIALVLRKTGVDLSKYRPSCLKRRVMHRMTTLGCSDLSDYAMYVRERPNEVDYLLDAVTIHVTEFFRDSDVFESIAKDVLRPVIEQKLASGDRALRIWSAGCATGEEAYSVAIILLDILSQEQIEMEVEVIASDISGASIDTASAGVYEECACVNIPAYLRDRYFTYDGSAYSVTREVRQCIRFEVHDLFTAAPSSHFDVVVCRNVMIHFGNDMRNPVLSHIYSSLNDGGMLVLGRAEVLTGPESHNFELVNPTNKIYRTKASVHESVKE
jgi:chemotaxis methyl-accepting protein methylase/DNA-binding NarL/FixJ family response regulator